MSDAPRSHPLNLHQWIIHRPNTRSTFHVDPVDEVCMQLKGSVRVDLMTDGIRPEHRSHEGHVMLMAANVPYSPLRPADTWGVVIARPRCPVTCL